jgi:hypothetical protein
MHCVLDTAAANTTRNLHLFTALANAYPHTIASIYSPSDYSPITLSGIIQQGGASIMLDLTVGFQFHHPYLTREGMPTNLVIAAGSNVMVNIILGLLFITQTRLIIDTSDQVAELQAFDTPPFPIDFHHAMCTNSVINKARAAANAAQHVNIIREVESLEAYIATKKGMAYLHQAKDPVNSVCLLAMWANSVIFLGPSSCSNPSTVTIGSSIDPFACNNSNIYANAIDIHNLLTSVRVHASAETRVCLCMPGVNHAAQPAIMFLCYEFHAALPAEHLGSTKRPLGGII